MLAKQSPFNLENDDAYRTWRKRKLRQARTNKNKPIVKLISTPPHFLSKSSIKSIIDEIRSDNYCLYSIANTENISTNDTKIFIHNLARSIGIKQLNRNICSDQDSLTSIFQKDKSRQREYIPYTNKKLSWHTDGYYNNLDKTIYSMLLHCFNSANEGGESAFLDHEIIYILMRDENPNWIKALCHNKSMTIPANILEGKEIRAEQTGPVFSVSPQGHLHMRYSARTKNIQWREDKQTLEATSFLQHLLNNNTDYIIEHKLRSGEGVISRNILHRRNAYFDSENKTNTRLLFRGRFYDEIQEETSC